MSGSYLDISINGTAFKAKSAPRCGGSGSLGGSTGLSYVDVSVDSQYRDFTLYPTPSDYVLNLINLPNQPIALVELVNAKIPNTQYNIDTHNNLLDVSVLATTYQLTLTPGQYTATEFATYLSNFLNTELPGTGTWTVTNNNVNGGPRTFTFTNDTNAFTFLFKTGPTAPQNRQCSTAFGFSGLTDKTSTNVLGTETLNSEQLYNFGEVSAFKIQLVFDNRTYSPILTSDNAATTFAVNITEKFGAFVNYQNNTLATVADVVDLIDTSKTFNISGKRLGVTFLGKNKQLFNFNGVNHTFLLRIWTIKQ